MIYLATFAITALLLWLSGKCVGALKGILVVVALAVPCFIAGVRDTTVGVDVMTYAYYQYLKACDISLLAFLEVYSDTTAIGWNLMTWVVCHSTRSLVAYLFVIEAFCLVPVYIGLRRLTPDYEWAGVLIWSLLFYAQSLNGMRQMIAVAITFCGLEFALERRPFRFVLCILLAMLFHQTVVFAALLYPVVALLRMMGSARSFFGKYQGLAIAALLLIFMTAALVFGDRVVIALSALKASYAYQVNHLGSGDVSWGYLFLLVFIGITWFVARADFDTSSIADKNVGGVSLAELHTARGFGLVCALAAIGCVLWQLNYLSESVGRLGSYFTVYACLMASLMAAKGGRSGLALAVYVLLSLVFFVAMTVVLGKSGAWPYTSVILGIG